MNEPNDHTAHKPGRPAADRAHPRIYTVLVILSAWFVVAAWSFAGGGIVDYLLVVISGFIFGAIVLPLILFSIDRSDGAANDAAPRSPQPPLRDWIAWDYETWTGPLSGAQAATQILLPIAAAAVGMTVIGILFHVAA